MFFIFMEIYVLYQQKIKKEVKIKKNFDKNNPVQSDGSQKIQSQLEIQWQEDTPIFISEGTPKQKENSIRNSNYLNIVNNQVIPSLKKNIVILGSSLDDTHIFEKIDNNKDIDKIAISIYDNGKEGNVKESKDKAKGIFKNKKDCLKFFRFESTWEE